MTYQNNTANQMERIQLKIIRGFCSGITDPR